MDWCFTGPNNEERTKHCAPLGEAPTAARQAYFKSNIAWCFENNGDLGGCFALLNSSGVVVGGAICVPPDQPRHKWLEVARNILALGIPPASVMAAEKRLESLTKTMETGHQKWAAGRHWYIQCAGAHPEHQGKGHGKR